MIYRNFGSTGFRCSAIGMGTYYDFGWIISARLFRRFPGRQGIIKALRTGLDAGINLIDTAELYMSEPLVAEAIQGYRREDLFIATKAFPTHFRREKLIRACEKSLANLRLGYIDLYQLHFPSLRAPISETMKTLEFLQEEGKIRHIGVSNFSVSQLKEAQSCLEHAHVASIQVQYNLMHRDPERDLLPYCEEQGIALMAYYPVAHGKLARQEFERSFGEIKTKYGLKTNAQVSLTYLISKSNAVFPIPRARTPEHVAENAALGDKLFTPEDIELLERLFPGS
jgi:diketogulonate reductase-like aldo/keto reductase